jgi:UDP-N-acetylmuramate dehydrogenase
VLITDIYAAREHDTMGVSAQDLVSGLGHHPDARYAGSLDTATALLLAELRPGDVFLTLGAGDGNRVGEEVLAALRQTPGRHPPQVQAADRHDRLAAAIAESTGLTVLRSESLAKHTTMRVGGPADLFVAAGTLPQLVAVLALAREHGVSAWLLGGGSNVLVSDAGVRGLVIANGCREIRRHEGHVVWAESGANLAGLARQTVRWALSGLEWGVSVPGTVGGAVVGNAGAHGGSVADNLLRATLVQADGRIVEWPATRFQFAYRYSTLKEQIRAGESAPLVLAAAFQLAGADPAQVEARATEFLAYRRATQPVEPSAGSIFQNPPGDYAGRILDSLGFKGRHHGGAAFSTGHANFIVNHGGATAADVISLIDEARQATWRQMAVALVPEILFIGAWPEQPPYRALPGLEARP